MSESKEIRKYGKVGQRARTALAALTHKRNLKAVYHSQNTQENGLEARERTLVPVAVFHLPSGERGEEMTYLSAFDSIRGARCTFRLDRFSKLQLADDMAPAGLVVYPAHFNVRAKDRRRVSRDRAEKLVETGYWAFEPVTEILVDPRLS